MACAQPELRQQVENLLRFRGAGSFRETRGRAARHGAIQRLPRHPAKLGAIIGPYKLLQQIGEGGMGVVWMAEQTQPVCCKVAVKVIKPGMDSRQVIAFRGSNGVPLAMMDHVNIARVFDGAPRKLVTPTSSWSLSTALPITDIATTTA